MQSFDRQTFLGIDITSRGAMWTELENLRKGNEEDRQKIERLERAVTADALDRSTANARIRELEQELATARDKISKIDQPRFRGRFCNKEQRSGE